MTEAQDDIRKGRTTRYKSPEDFMKSHGKARAKI